MNDELNARITALEQSNQSFADLTFLQRTINEDNKKVLVLLMDTLEALPLTPETQKLVQSLSRRFRKMAYSKIEG